MMLFGIVMHAGLSYDGVPATPLWGISDAGVTPLAGWLQLASKLFRMQAFFLVAGFFSALLVSRMGFAGFLWNRALRIAGPFVVFWFATFTLLRLAFVSAQEGNNPLANACWALTSGRLWVDPYPIHLWFLEYLLIYCGLAGLLSVVWCAMPVKFQDECRGVFRRCLQSSWLPLVLGLCVLPALLISPHGSFGIPLSFRPGFSSLLAYAIYFFFGWALFSQRELLPQLANRGARTLAAGVAIAVLSAAVTTDRGASAANTQEVPEPLPWSIAAVEPTRPLPGLAARGEGFAGSFGDRPTPIASAGGSLIDLVLFSSLQSITTSLLVLGLVGTFLRLFDRPNAWVRYVSDASYWLYLCHFPVIAWLTLLLSEVRCPAAWKLLANATLTTLLLMAVYEGCVRTSWLGRWINGKRGAPPPWLAQPFQPHTSPSKTREHVMIPACESGGTSAINQGSQARPNTREFRHGPGTPHRRA